LVTAPSPLTRRLFLGIAFGILIYAGVAIWIGVESFRSALAKFPWALLPVAMGLSFTNYLIRFVKWERYRKLLGIQLDRRTSFEVYMAGFSMGITPGKMGEVLKSWLIKKINGTPIHHSAPIVIAERVTDLLGYLLLVAIAGLATLPEYQWVFWSVLAVCAVMIALAGSQSFSQLVYRVIKRTPFFWRLAPKVQGSFQSTRVLLSPREIVLPTLTSMLSWGCECVGFWLIARAMAPGGELSFSFAVFAYAFSAVAGALLILFPGGIGPTEGFLGSLLRRQIEPGFTAGHPGLAGLTGTALQEAPRELARASAGAAVLLTRICTLWFGVGVGLIFLARFRRRFGELEEAALEEG